MSSSEKECNDLFKQYSDTVMVSAAIFKLFGNNPSFGKFVGVGHELYDANGSPLTPDIATTYNAKSRGLVFEIKYSLGASASDEILKLKRYFGATNGWDTTTGKVTSVDVVLICSAEDREHVCAVIDDLLQDPANGFLSSPGFSVWQWMFGSAKSRHDELWFEQVRGSCRNSRLDGYINVRGGVKVPDEVLEHARFLYMFIRDRPPVQYTIGVLLHNVLPRNPDQSECKISFDTVCTLAKALFPPWWAADSTAQIRNGWIREALETLWDLKMIRKELGKDLYVIPVKLLKKDIIQSVCKQLVYYSARSYRTRTHRKRRLASAPQLGKGPLDQYVTAPASVVTI